MDNQIGDRIHQYIAYKGIPQSHFAYNIGRSKQEINNWLRNDPIIPPKHIITILDAYPEINANWLIRGEESMIRKGYEQDLIALERSRRFIEENPIEKKPDPLKLSIETLNQLTETVLIQSRTIEFMRKKIYMLENTDKR